MKNSEQHALKDILRAIDRVALTIEGHEFADYDRDFRIHLIVERCVEIISEASRRLSPESKAAYPQIPWRAIESVGNKLRHEYQRVDPLIMWKIATQSLPELRPVMQTLIED